MELIETVESVDVAQRLLDINAYVVIDWLVAFLKQECIQVKKVDKAVIALSGGVDSAVTAALCVKAFGAENVLCYGMPYKLSSQASWADAQLVADELGISLTQIPITEMVDGYACQVPDLSPTRLGNICSRCRTTILFDRSAEVGGLPIGTGNKTERFFGYFTWHGDDAPPVNPLGDLYKSQVWKVAEALNLPSQVISKPPTADLVPGQTDESDFGLSYPVADSILALHLNGYSRDRMISLGFQQQDVDWVIHKVASTHWKRHLPIVAMLSDTSINDYYLRPVDYR